MRRDASRYDVWEVSGAGGAQRCRLPSEDVDLAWARRRWRRRRQRRRCLGGADDATKRLPFTIARQVVIGWVGGGERGTRGFREKRAKRAGAWVRAASLCATLSYVSLSLRARRFQSIVRASRSYRMYAICIVNWARWCNFRFGTEYLLVSLGPSDIFIADAVNA